MEKFRTNMLNWPLYNLALRFNPYFDLFMRQPKAVIFDMDGVLIDSEPIHCEIERTLFIKLGLNVSAEVHKTYLGTAGDFMYNDIKTRFGLSESINQLLEMDEAFRCEYFRSLEVISLNEGVLSLLQEIKKSGIRLAVATSSSPLIARTLLGRCGILSIFDAVVTTSDAGKSKPAPDVYLLAANMTGVAPADCLVFEDSPNGLMAAKNAGMFCMAIKTESVNVDELSGADHVIETFDGMTLHRLTDLFSFKLST